MSLKATFMTMTICLMFRKAVELIWNTEVLSTTCCEGEDKILVWNYSTEENDRIRQLQWYYNKTTLICYKSESYGFHVTPLYEGRVEQYGISGILLKHLSSNDTGEYTLYPKLSGEKFRNVQAILLTVFEPPIFKCKPTITSISKHLISCSMKKCGKSDLLPEWRLEGQQDPVGNDSYLILKSSWTDKLVFCCLNEPRMECLNGNKFDFCTPNPISPTINDTRTKDDIDTENQIETHTVNVPNKRDTKNLWPVYALLIIIFVLSLVMMMVVLLVVRYSRRRHMSVNTKLKNAKIAEECTKERAPLQRASDPTVSDGHSIVSGRNQNIQIVNNINMDSNILSGILNSYTALRAELMALKEDDLNFTSSIRRSASATDLDNLFASFLERSCQENRQLENRLHHHECSIEFTEIKKLYNESFEVTNVKACDSSVNVTETT